MAAIQIFHFLAAFHYLFSQWYDVLYVDIPFMTAKNEFFGGRMKFLTIWNLLLQAFFFTICFLNDVIGTNEKFPKRTPLIRKIKDIILPSLAFPLSMFVGLTFWSLYLIDRELIFPKVLDQYFPFWLNHVMHTNIMLFALIEMLTSYRRYPSRKFGLSLLVLFMTSYLVWIHVLNVYTNRWVYPVLEVLPLPGRIVFFALALVLAVGLYILGEKINGIRWGKVKSKSK